MSEPVFISVAQVEAIHARQIERFGGTQGIHIPEAQAFLDGNKRTAIGAALAFLELNGVTTSSATMELHAAMIAIAEKRLTRAELAALLRTLYLA